MRDKHYKDFYTGNCVPYDTYRILGLDSLMQVERKCRVTVAIPSGQDIPDFIEVLLHEINALSNRVYKSRECIKQISRLTYVLSAVRSADYSNKTSMTCEDIIMYDVSVYPVWSSVSIARAEAFA